MSETTTETQVPEPLEYQGIDTRNPAANLATRSNIVPDGPGTVADHLPVVIAEQP